jgi:hypothetical protein
MSAPDSRAERLGIHIERFIAIFVCQQIEPSFVVVKCTVSECVKCAGLTRRFSHADVSLEQALLLNFWDTFNCTIDLAPAVCIHFCRKRPTINPRFNWHPFFYASFC